MSDLTNEINDKQQIAKNAVELTIEKYKSTLDNVIFSKTIQKNVEIIHKRIDKIEDYLQRSAEFSWQNFALELGLSFGSSLIVGYGLKKFGLKKDALKRFKREDLYLKSSFNTKWLVFSLDPKDQVRNLALVSQKNFLVMAKKHNRLVDLAYASVKDNIFKDAAYDAFMSLIFATSQGLIHNGLTETHQKSKGQFISLEKVKTSFKNDIIKYWGGIYNSIEASTEYTVLNNFIDSIQKYNANWDRDSKLEEKFKIQLNKLLKKYFEQAFYVGLSGRIGGYLTQDYLPYRHKTYPNSSKNIFKVMTDTKHYSSLLLNQVGKKATASLITGMNCQMFKVPSHSRGSFPFRTVFLVGCDFVLCELKDRNSFILAIRLTRFKIAGNNAELKRKSWTKIPPVKELNYDSRRFPDCTKFKKYIAYKSYKKESYLIDLNKNTGFMQFEIFDQDLILNYLVKKTKKVTEKELKGIPKFNSYDNFVDLSLVTL